MAKMTIQEVEELCQSIGVTKKEDIERMKDIFIKPAFGTKENNYTFTKPQ